ncbi:MAG: hypothetical protein WDN10_04940 [bacterium]
MKRIAYIIPGYGESHTRQRGYDALAEMFKAKGIVPVHIEIDWHGKKPSRFGEYAKQFLQQYEKPRQTETYILGFSFGAIIALISAKQAKPTNLILCSPSPFFTEDMKTFKPALRKWWKENFVESDYSFDAIAPMIRQKTYVIVGDKEDVECGKRARAAKRNIRNSQLVTAKGAKHNISQKEYLAAVWKVVSKLR